MVDALFTSGTFSMAVPLLEGWLFGDTTSAGAVSSTDAVLVGGVFSELLAAVVSVETIFSGTAAFFADIFSVVASTKQPTAGVSLYLTHK